MPSTIKTMFLSGSFLPIILAGFLNPAHGIDISQALSQKFLKSKTPEFSRSAMPSTATSGIDNAIDEKNYFIGTGDVFQVSFIGLPSLIYIAEVNQNCDIYIPDLGVLKLGKMNLADAKVRIAEFAQNASRKSNEAYVALIQGKSATVSVTGDVAEPGTFTLKGTSRVLDALRMANRGEIPSINLYDYRRVECTTDSVVSTIDLFQYLFKNDLHQNPYCYPGTIISLRKATHIVYVFGATKGTLAGQIPLLPGETLADLVSLLKLDASADSGNIIIQNGSVSSRRVTRPVSLEDAGGIELSDGDIITISRKKEYPELLLVEVRGEVASPGHYPVNKTTTNAQDILEMAGGITESGNLGQAVILRRKKTVTDAAGSSATISEIAPALKHDLAVVRPEMNAAFTKLYTTNDYAVIQLRQTGLDVKIENSDLVVVPKRDRFIYISGNVERPGAYEFHEGKTTGYYIHKAGGYTRKADRGNSFIITAYDMALQFKDVRTVEEGDIIIIPDSIQNKKLSTVILPVLQTFFTAVTTVLTVLSIIAIYK